MKYLIFTFLIIFGSTTLAAQDTLYVKGKSKPYVFNIIKINKYSIEYTSVEGDLVYQLKIKDIEKVNFHKKIITIPSQINSTPTREIKPELDEFHSALSVNYSGINNMYIGLNYLHRLNEVILDKENHNLYVNFGGGFYKRRLNQLFSTSNEINRAKGYYVEFGSHIEMRSKKNPKNRMHLGVNLNHRFEKNEVSPINSEADSSIIEQFSLQFPIGYTYRTSNGFFFSTGLKISTGKVLSLIHLGCGFTLF